MFNASLCVYERERERRSMRRRQSTYVSVRKGIENIDLDSVLCACTVCVIAVCVCVCVCVCECIQCVCVCVCVCVSRQISYLWSVPTLLDSTVCSVIHK